MCQTNPTWSASYGTSHQWSPCNHHQPSGQSPDSDRVNAYVYARESVSEVREDRETEGRGWVVDWRE